MAKDEEAVLVIDDRKKKIKIIGCLIILILVIVLAVFGIVNRNKFKYFGADMVLHDYTKSYINLDSKKFCKVIPDEIINKSYENRDKCNEALKEMFSAVKEKRQELKGYELKDKDEVTSEELDSISFDLNQNYGISPKSVKKIVRYSLSFKYKDADGQKDVKVYIAKINKKWYVVDQKVIS